MMSVIYLLLLITVVRGETGSIEGKVTDRERGAPLQGATIRIFGTAFTATSDEDGRFEISDIPPGTYTIEIGAPGYEPVIVHRREVAAQKALFLEVQLGEEFIYTLDEIVVTATRVRERIGDIDGSVSVMNRSAIEALPTVTVVDVLDMLPGFQTYSADGNSMSQGVNVRGFTGGGLAEYLLVMVDGVPINDLETGLVNWNLIPVGKVERIEVLRGPSSALYGDMALGGVINIMTGETQGQSSTEVSFEGGSYGEYSGSLHLNRNSGAAAYEIFASKQRRDGWREHSDWRGETVTGRVRSAMGKGWNLSLSSINQRIRSQTPGPLTVDQLQEDREQSIFPLDGEDQRRHLLFLNVDREDPNRWRVETNLSFQYKDDDMFRTLFFETKEQLKDTYSLGVNTQTSRQLSWKEIEHHLVLGAGLEWGRMRSTYYDLLADGERSGSPATEGSGTRRKMAAYLQDKIVPVTDVSLTLGLRWDGIYDDYDDELNPASTFTSDKSAFSAKIGLNWKPDGKGHLYANVGRAFKAPTMEQLFDQRPFSTGYGDGFVFISNAGLKAQTGTNYEIGMKRKLHPLLEASLALYQMDMEDEIDFDLGNLTYVNIGQSRHRGFEGEARFKPFSGLSSFLSYTYSDAQYRSGENTGNQINNIPHHMMSCGLLYASTLGLTSGVFLHSVKDQYLDGSNEHPLADYTTVNVRLSFEKNHLSLSLDMNNLFDAEYSSFGYVDPLMNLEMLYPAAGRNIRGGVTVTL